MCDIEIGTFNQSLKRRNMQPRPLLQELFSDVTIQTNNDPQHC